MKILIMYKAGTTVHSGPVTRTLIFSGYAKHLKPARIGKNKYGHVKLTSVLKEYEYPLGNDRARLSKQASHAALSLCDLYSGYAKDLTTTRICKNKYGQIKLALVKKEYAEHLSINGARKSKQRLPMEHNHCVT